MKGSAEILIEAWQSGRLLVALLLEPVFVIDKPTLQYKAKIGLFASPGLITVSWCESTKCAMAQKRA